MVWLHFVYPQKLRKGKNPKVFRFNFFTFLVLKRKFTHPSTHPEKPVYLSIMIVRKVVANFVSGFWAFFFSNFQSCKYLIFRLSDLENSYIFFLNRTISQKKLLFPKSCSQTTKKKTWTKKKKIATANKNHIKKYFFLRFLSFRFLFLVRFVPYFLSNWKTILLSMRTRLHKKSR